MNGRVKRFSDFRGYGFITGEDGEDYFVHYTMIDSIGFRTLSDGEGVQFTPAFADRGRQAHCVKRVAVTPEIPSAPLVLKINPFTPQDPVTDPNKFAGRAGALINAVDCLFNFKNILVTGARGIGKSSVAYQLVKVTEGDTTLLNRIGIDTRGFNFSHLTGDHRCMPGNTLQAIARGLLSSFKVGRGERPTCANHKTELKIDLKLLSTTHQEMLTPLPFEEIILEFVAGTEEILREAPEGTTGVCYLIDEIDLLDTSLPMAPFLKAVIEKFRMDGVGVVSFILSGVTGSTTELIAQHSSAGRLTETITLQPMVNDEMESLINSALQGTGVGITATAKKTIIDLSAQFPAPSQLIGYHSFRLDSNDLIDADDVNGARDFIVQNLKLQEFQGRLEKLSSGITPNILRILASSKPEGLRIDSIARELRDEPDRVAGSMGNLIRDGYVKRNSNLYAIAEPLFRIYLKMFFGIS